MGIQEVASPSRPLPDGSYRDINSVRTTPVLPPSVAATETSMLETVLQYGTGKAAAIGQFAAGKTGTTSNYGDAWFVGWDSKYTVAVWVGYPNKLIPMTTDFNGTPVLGGTFPALIWHDFMLSALQIDKSRAEAAALRRANKGKGSGTSGLTEVESPSSSALPAPASAPSSNGNTGGKPAGTGKGAGGEEGAGANGTQTPKSSTPAPGSTPAPSGQSPATPAPNAPSTSTPPASTPSTPPTTSNPAGTGGVGPGG